MYCSIGPGCIASKSDIESAFRLLPVHLECFHLLMHGGWAVLLQYVPLDGLLHFGPLLRVVQLLSGMVGAL